MLHCERYSPADGRIVHLSPEEVLPVLQQQDGLVWIDVSQPDARDLAWLEATFHFHPLAMEDVQNERQRAKVDRYEDYYFFVLRAIRYDFESHKVDSLQLGLFVGRYFLVTIHRDAIPALEQARRRWSQSNLPQEATAYLFYLVTDVVVDSYFPIVDAIGDLIDDLDTEIFVGPARTTLEDIFTLRRSLLSIRKILGPLRDAFNELIREEEGGTIFPIRYTRAYFTDVYDHILRLTDFVDTYRDMLSGSLDAYQSSLSNKLNENMQRLTVAATVLATATVITGFYGMNLQGMMINSAWPYGGALIFALLVVITAVEIWLFRRRGWI